MSLWQGKSKGNKFGYQIFVWVLKKYGVQPAYFLLRFVAFYYFVFSVKASKQIYHLYHSKLGYSSIKSLSKIYNNYFQLGQSIIDKVVLMSGINNKFTFKFDGEENLREMVALQKGGILLSAHIGNWDIAGHLLKRLQTTINIVMYDGEQAQIKDYLNEITGKKTVNFIFIKKDLSHICQISEALKNNELICMHADRFIEGNKTISINFLGSPAKFPFGPFVLANTFKVPVCYVFAIKESKLHYHFFASKFISTKSADKATALQQMANLFAENMEEKVKQYPEQWFNYYNFWQ